MAKGAPGVLLLGWYWATAARAARICRICCCTPPSLILLWGCTMAAATLAVVAMAATMLVSTSSSAVTCFRVLQAVRSHVGHHGLFGCTRLYVIRAR